MARVSFKSLFLKFRDESVVNRYQQYAYWTLPYLMADQREVSGSGRIIVERDFQEIGALLVNNLASKLARILFPTQYSFFKASASKAFEEHAAKRGVGKEELRQRFAELEIAAKERLFTNSGYAALILSLKYLIVTGSALIYRDSPGSTIVTYGPETFAIRRDGAGKMLDCVLREFTVVEALPQELQQALRAGNRTKYSRAEQQVEKYTRIHFELRSGIRGFSVRQQVDDLDVGGEDWFPESLCPWMAPTWNLIPGEHYGRGMVEDYAGGFARLSSLSEASALYGVEMTRVIHLVGAGSGTDVDDIATAESGEWRRGDPQSVSAYEAGDAKKLEQLAANIIECYQRLSRAFMYTGNARQAERVTAYELQQEAQEAESSLGGVYSTLSGGMQVPLAHILMAETSTEALTGLVTGELKPDVTAGIPALGRTSDVQNLLQAGQEIGAILPVIQLDKRIDPQRVVDMILSGRSIDPKSIMYTPEQQKANREAEAAAQNAQAELLKAQTLGQQGDQIQQTLNPGA